TQRTPHAHATPPTVVDAVQRQRPTHRATGDPPSCPIPLAGPACPAPPPWLPIKGAKEHPRRSHEPQSHRPLPPCPPSAAATGTAEAPPHCSTARIKVGDGTPIAS